MNSAKVILVTYPDDFSLQEAQSLVESSSPSMAPRPQIVKAFTQKYLNHSRYGLGSGKAEEMKEFVKQIKADQIVVDEHLTPKQIYNLEKLTGVQVIDRERLILNIFHSRATTTEAKLQIELAEVKYEMPRVRESAKLTSGSTERAGKGGMGEYTVDVKFRDLKRRMSFIKKKLADAHTKRELYRQQRLKTKMPIVSLIGYTSSGKTTLFNLLTSENKEISSSLFTTLSTTTRTFRVNNEKQERESPLLLIDTVGFISRLPHYMIDAFKSTLEESLAADLILLLIDASEKFEDIRIKYNSCWKVLDELKVDKSKVFVILTKCDGIISISERIDTIANDLSVSNPIIISSNTGYGIRKLKTMIAHNLHSQFPSREEHLTNVKIVPEEGAYVIAATDLPT
ncbi:MAG TPA: GTPase HflX [Nitrososphaeraceae archaeon]|nr:GTPase HflX [Nitrososphaeraceae archaeon]